MVLSKMKKFFCLLLVGLFLSSCTASSASSVSEPNEIASINEDALYSQSQDTYLVLNSLKQNDFLALNRNSTFAYPLYSVSVSSTESSLYNSSFIIVSNLVPGNNETIYKTKKLLYYSLSAKTFSNISATIDFISDHGFPDNLYTNDMRYVRHDNLVPVTELKLIGKTVTAFKTDFSFSFGFCAPYHDEKISLANQNIKMTAFPVPEYSYLGITNNGGQSAYEPAMGNQFAYADIKIEFEFGSSYTGLDGFSLSFDLIVDEISYAIPYLIMI